jgi:hypothetical protein
VIPHYGISDNTNAGVISSYASRGFHISVANDKAISDRTELHTT